jgi:hypothetical protein
MALLNTNYTVSPYLQQQIDALQGQYNNNLTRNILPGARSNAVAAGGVGGSRQGIMEGLAAGDSQTGFANASTNLLGQDYTNAMQRNLTQYGMDQQAEAAAAQVAAQRYGTDKSYDLGMTNAANNRYNTDQTYNLGVRGQDKTYDLGMTNANNYRYNTDQNYNLGMTQNATNLRGQDKTYDLGMTNAANYRHNTDQSQILGMTNADNYRHNTDVTNQLGMVNANNNRYNTDMTYNLGMTNAGNSANANAMSFYTNQRNLDQNGLRLGADLYGAGITGEWKPVNEASSVFQPYTGFGTTTASGQQGGGWQGALGGGLGAAQLAKNFGWWGK